MSISTDTTPHPAHPVSARLRGFADTRTYINLPAWVNVRAWEAAEVTYSAQDARQVRVLNPQD